MLNLDGIMFVLLYDVIGYIWYYDSWLLFEMIKNGVVEVVRFDDYVFNMLVYWGILIDDEIIVVFFYIKLIWFEDICVWYD